MTRDCTNTILSFASLKISRRARADQFKKSCVIIILFIFIGPVYADIVFDGRLSQGDFSRYWVVEADGYAPVGPLAPFGIPGRIQKGHDPAGSDQSVLVATRFLGDRLTNGGMRSEVSAPKDPMGSERWYSWGYYLPAPWKNVSDRNIIAQIHDTADKGESNWRGPALAVVIKDNEVKLENAFDYDRITSPSDIPPVIRKDYEIRELASWALETERWVHLDLHVKWAGDDSGFLEFWKDGVLLFEERNHINTFNDEGGLWFKSGIYGTPSVEWPHMNAYLTGVKIGDEKETFQTMSISVVPEPNAYLMMIIGLMSISFACRLRRFGFREEE
jgi:hypothetical protein